MFTSYRSFVLPGSIGRSINTRTRSRDVCWEVIRTDSQRSCAHREYIGTRTISFRKFPERLDHELMKISDLLRISTNESSNSDVRSEFNFPRIYVSLRNLRIRFEASCAHSRFHNLHNSQVRQLDSPIAERFIAWVISSVQFRQALEYPTASSNLRVPRRFVGRVWIRPIKFPVNLSLSLSICVPI